MRSRIKPKSTANAKKSQRTTTAHRRVFRNLMAVNNPPRIIPVRNRLPKKLLTILSLGRGATPARFGLRPTLLTFHHPRLLTARFLPFLPPDQFPRRLRLIHRFLPPPL